MYLIPIFYTFCPTILQMKMCVLLETMTAVEMQTALICHFHTTAAVRMDLLEMVPYVKVCGVKFNHNVLVYVEGRVLRHSIRVLSITVE